jgi:hypothetical protein
MQGNDHRSSEKGCERGMCQICLKKMCVSKKKCVKWQRSVFKKKPNDECPEKGMIRSGEQWKLGGGM